MKAVLMSIQPKWCELIASRKKTVEVRKTKPKLETPFKVYIYQTLKPVSVMFHGTGGHISEYDKTLCYNKRSGKVIGEFVCDEIYDITPHFDTPTFPNQYICGWEYGKEFDCLPFEELTSYLNGKKGYGYHISELVIYDEPKELSEFRRPCNHHSGDCFTCDRFDYIGVGCSADITRPPQSWCYVKDHPTEKGGEADA